MHTLLSDANRNRRKNVARRSRGRFHPRNARVPLLTPLEMLERGISFQVFEESLQIVDEMPRNIFNRNGSKNVARRARRSFNQRNARVPLLTPLEMPERSISFQVFEESLQIVDEMPRNIFNRNGSKNVARRARRSFNQRSIFTEHGNARVPPLTPFETFEHDILFLDRCATNEATEDTDDIDEELLEIEDSMDTNVSDTWSINNGSSEDEGEDDSTGENEEASREKMLTPSPKIGLNSPSISDEPRVMHNIEFMEAAAGRNRSRNVARRGRPSPLPKNALVYLTPFKRGETFNGFAKNLELEEIVGCSYEVDNMLLCDVKWRNDGNRIRRIEASLLRRYCPGMLADFYERLIIANIANETPICEMKTEISNQGL